MTSLEHVHFVVIGAGGLGCPALLGLSAAGARHVTIVDPDRVESSNLQRQVLYTTADVGRPKAEAAAWALKRRVPSLQVRAEFRALKASNVDTFVSDLAPQTIVLDCTDDPDVKFAVNDACLRHGTPAVIGAALGLRGQCLPVRAGDACYRCIYEAPPAEVPSCAEAGVLGAIVGLAGFLMSSAALALCREGETAGALLAFDGLGSAVQTLRPRPRPGCTACAHAGPPRFSPVRATA